jgi:hypothetical protein
LQALPSVSAIPNTTDSGLVDIDNRIIYCPENSNGHTSKNLIKDKQPEEYNILHIQNVQIKGITFYHQLYVGDKKTYGCTRESNGRIEKAAY